MSQSNDNNQCKTNDDNDNQEEDPDMYHPTAGSTLTTTTISCSSVLVARSTHCYDMDSYLLLLDPIRLVVLSAPPQVE